MRTRSPLVAVSVVLLIAVVLVSDLLFLDPATDRPQHADAILVLGGDGDRIATATRLGDAGFAPTLVLSVATIRYGCRGRVPNGMQRICFLAHPFSTQGEARFIAALARRRHWSRIIVVSGHAQTTRARLRIQRCWSGQLLMIPAPAPPLRTRVSDVAYEWGAMLKAELWQRGC